MLDVALFIGVFFFKLPSKNISHDDEKIVIDLIYWNEKHDDINYYQIMVCVWVLRINQFSVKMVLFIWWIAMFHRT